jgi:hypothetical protein
MRLLPLRKVSQRKAVLIFLFRRFFLNAAEARSEFSPAFLREQLFCADRILRPHRCERAEEGQDDPSRKS